MNERESLGKTLQKERESKNISLKELAKNTKIREPLLRAIEEDRYQDLPSPTYVRGFLLAYAKYVGLNPNEVLLCYDHLLKGKPNLIPEARSEKKEGGNKKQVWVIAGVLLVCLIASYFFHPYWSPAPREMIPAKPEMRQSPSPLPVLQTTETIPVAESKPFLLELKAAEKVWVRIQVDDQPEREMTFNPGEGRSYQGLHRIDLLIGNAGGLDLNLNGKGLGRFGKSGEVITLSFTPQGVEIKSPERVRSP